MSKHTPGPWNAVPRDVDADKPGNMDIGESSGLGWDIEGPPEPQLRGQFAKGSDAQLIEAAPDMLAALELCHEHLNWDSPIELKAVIDAIAKAEGRRHD